MHLVNISRVVFVNFHKRFLFSTAERHASTALSHDIHPSQKIRLFASRRYPRAKDTDHSRKPETSRTTSSGGRQRINAYIVRSVLHTKKPSRRLMESLTRLRFSVLMCMCHSPLGIDIVDAVPGSVHGVGSAVLAADVDDQHGMG